MRRGRATLAGCASFVAALAAVVVPLQHAAADPADSVDEINCNWGDSGDSLWIHYRNPDALTPVDTVYYGLDATYGRQANAAAPAILPVDSPSSSFREAQLTGLALGQMIHYRIGDNGLDHTCGTPPTGAFRWDDLGDTGSTLCTPWVAITHSQIAADAPTFVTHGGDISYANDCGQAAVHQYYNDQQVWSTSAAFQPVWGNHEYGAATAAAPPGTPRDTLANYKSRSSVTNPQLVPNDTATQTSHPGCPALVGTSTNSCRGEDWGWFEASGVLFISYPEPGYNALADWKIKADALMARAQADPAVDFIVTYGHRPAYSNQQLNSTNADVATAIDALGDRYGAGVVPGGKYVLNVGHHVHGEEAFAPMHGVVNMTNGGGGEGSSALSSTTTGSVYANGHPGYLTGDYDPTAHTLHVRLRCGPAYAPNPRIPCDLGSTLYDATFTAGQAPPPPPPPAQTQLLSNSSVESSGTGFLTPYSSSDEVTWTSEASYDGSHSIRVRNTAASAQSAGLTTKPIAVASTEAGATYTGSVWVRTTSPNQSVTLSLRECTSTGSCTLGTAAVTTTLVDTGWHQLQTSRRAIGSGNQLRYVVYASSLPPGTTLYADLFSLTKRIG